MLLQWGLEKADEAGQQVYTESTPFGLPFYISKGFVKRTERSFLDGRYTLSAMSRSPAAYVG